MSYSEGHMEGYRMGEGERIALATANSNLRHEIEKLNSALAIAVGIISTIPSYEKQHPELIMEMILKEARRG